MGKGLKATTTRRKHTQGVVHPKTGPGRGYVRVSVKQVK